MIDGLCRNQNRPSTPEGERARIRAADHLERLQMTNPDERRSRISLRVSTESEDIVPLNYGAALAAQIPQVQMPADWDAPRQFPLPGVVPQFNGAPMGNGVGIVGLGMNVAAAIPQVQLPVGWDAPLANPVPVAPLLANRAATIPEVQLPAGWDAPLANPVPVVPPAPPLQRRRGRGRGRAWDHCIPFQVSMQILHLIICIGVILH